jgi:hypothetical protein
VRLVGRLVVALLSLIVLAAAVYGGSRALDWAQSGDALGLRARDPVQPVRLATLDAHTRAVAGRAWFGDYFATMVFTREGDGSSASPAIVVKWEQPTVTVTMLNDGGPGIRSYLRLLVRRLDRLQGQVHFRIGDVHPLITVQFLDHDTYVRRNGTGSVGNTRTRYYAGSPGLIRARITVDVGIQNTADEVKSTLIHELTHAIGAGGHFVSPGDRRRSVMYEANTLTDWSQNDASVIRILYSPSIRSGMSASQVRTALRSYPRAKR